MDYEQVMKTTIKRQINKEVRKRFYSIKFQKLVEKRKQHFSYLMAVSMITLKQMSPVYLFHVQYVAMQLQCYAQMISDATTVRYQINVPPAY